MAAGKRFSCRRGCTWQRCFASSVDGVGYLELSGRGTILRTYVLGLIANRLGSSALTLLIVSFAVFFATAMLPGDTATILLGQAATPEAVAGLRAAMHLDEPAFFRFARWLFGLLQGDLGTSYVNNVPVAKLIGARFVNTMRLAGIVTLCAVPLSLTLGITAAMFRGSVYDRIVTVLTIGVISVPEFMIATSAVLLFSVYLKWLPALSFASDVSSFWQVLKIYAMPVITLTFVVSAQMIRMTRAAVIDTINTPMSRRRSSKARHAGVLSCFTHCPTPSVRSQMRSRLPSPTWSVA